jgi:hypothetical protein
MRLLQNQIRPCDQHLSWRRNHYSRVSGCQRDGEWWCNKCAAEGDRLKRLRVEGDLLSPVNWRLMTGWTGHPGTRCLLHRGFRAHSLG